MNKVLAIDMGATSIRAIIGYLKNDQLVTEEVMRFNHEIRDVNGRKHWDFDKLIKKIEKTILNYKDEITSIGIDTWGVDFGLLDKEKELIYNPISYRDELCEVGYNSIKNKIDFYNLFSRTGNQVMSINTLFQLETLKIKNDNYYNQARHLLMMPDLINFYLCGQIYGEKTICSTSQMFDLEKFDWNYKLIDELGLNSNLLPKIISNRSRIGTTRDSKIESLKNLDIDVVSVASHDTASAVYVTESYTNKNCAFLSSGTWSLIGCCNEKPKYSETSFKYNLTNETGYDGKNMFFKNVTGLYLIEKLRDCLLKEDGKKLSYDEITEIVKNTNQNITTLINVDYPVFAKETDNFIDDLDNYLLKSNQQSVDNKYNYFKIIYSSIVDKYKQVISYIENSINIRFNKIHVIGGGSKSPILCQMIADNLNIEVIAGPKEATAIGNILAQLEMLDESKNVREIVINSFKLKKYKPN